MKSDGTRKKIMFLMGGLNGGGAERVLVDTMNNLSPMKYDITLILVENSGVYLKELAPHIRYKYLTSPEFPRQKKRFYRLLHHVPFQWVYRFYIPERYDVEVAFLEGLATHIVGCSTYKSRKLAWIHTDMDENRWADVDYKSEAQHKAIYHNFDQINCVSNYCRDKFIKRFGKDYPVTTVYNVVCDDEIKGKAALPCEVIPQKQRFTFLSSGRFIMQKGFDRLLRIHKRLIDQGFLHDIWLLGDGSMKGELEQYILENHLQDSVKLLGFHSNPYPIMKEADCFVCSSRSEGYSTVVAEAFVLNVPVISVKCSGASELLDDGKYGLLVENDDDALYEGMKQILNDKELYLEMQSLAQRRGSYFSKKSRIADIEKILDM